MLIMHDWTGMKTFLRALDFLATASPALLAEAEAMLDAPLPIRKDWWEERGYPRGFATVFTTTNREPRNKR